MQPTKRLRTKGGLRNTKAISLDGSSDIVEVGNPCKRKMAGNGSPSQQSNGDGLPKGTCVDELRGTAQFAKGGSSNRRSRHKKSGAQASNRHPDRKRDSVSLWNKASGPPFKSGPLLSRRSKVSGDAIEDSDEDDTEELSEEAQSAKSNTKGTAVYSSSRFTCLEASSDDELSAVADKPRQTKLREGMTASATSSVPQNHRANSRLKRSAEGSPDELQDENLAKRRSTPSHQADIQRTNLAPSSRGEPDTVRVVKAVCLQELVYPATEGMPDHAPGATNKECHLSPSMSDNTVSWEAVDQDGVVIPELWWLTPKISKVTGIAWTKDSHTVRLNKSTDFNTEIATGSVLWIAFETEAEARRYCRSWRDSGTVIKEQIQYVQAII